MIEAKAIVECVECVECRVYGVPRPGGSKRAYGRIVHGKFNRKGGPVIATSVAPDCEKTEGWMAIVNAAAARAMHGRGLFAGPIRLDMTFIMPRPQSHYGTGRNLGVLKANAPRYHTTKPDRTKLLRSTEDALKGVVWKDDSQVVTGNTKKEYGEKPGAEIVITRAE